MNPPIPSPQKVVVVLLLALFPCLGVAQGNQQTSEVRGHVTMASGVPGMAPDQISFDASLDAAGLPQGTVAWTSASHGMPWTAPARYAWQLEVTGLLTVGDVATVQAIVVSCPAMPQDVGLPAVFTVIDGGNGNSAPDQVEANLNPMAPINSGNLKVKSASGAGPSCTVRGHGTFSQSVGVPSGGQFLDQISINAWLDGANAAQGMIVWTSLLHLLPGSPLDPIFEPGPGGSGRPRFIDVTNLALAGTVVQLTGTVVHSPQMPAEEGVVLTFTVEDLGNGGSGTPDRLSGVDILGGNFTVSSCPLPLLSWYIDSDGDSYGFYLGQFPTAPVPGATTDPGLGVDCYDQDPQLTC